MSPTAARDQTTRLARTDSPEAHALALQIREPWFRAQALAWVARYAPDRQVERIAGEALRAAGEAPDAYVLVGAGAWAIRALIERALFERASAESDRLLDRASSIEPASSRCEALFLLLQAALPSGPWHRTFDELVRAALPAEHWRQARNLRDAIAMIAAADEPLARRTLERVADDKTRRRIERELERRPRRPPRAFFW